MFRSGQRYENRDKIDRKSLNSRGLGLFGFLEYWLDLLVWMWSTILISEMLELGLRKVIYDNDFRQVL